MADSLLTLHISEHAKPQHSSLRLDDRRDVDLWLHRLRNFRNDQEIRAHCKRLQTPEELYTVQASKDIYVAFQISGQELTVLGFYHKDAITAFRGTGEVSIPPMESNGNGKFTPPPFTDEDLNAIRARATAIPDREGQVKTDLFRLLSEVQRLRST